MAEIGKEIGRKLSIKDMGYDKATILKMVLNNPDEKHFLVRFTGVANGVKPYKIKEGERAGEVAYGLLGAFEAINADGVSKDGSVCYLPGYVNDAIVAALQSSEDIVGVRVAIDVYARFDNDSATSYIFTANDLLNTGSETVAEVKEAIKALPLPSATPALEDKSKSR